jgi:hypothetical protein
MDGWMDGWMRARVQTHPGLLSVADKPKSNKHRLTQERARARRIFAEAEILYRLSQLARQHPGIVRPDMVNRWTQQGFDGRFTSDAAFVNSDPRVRFAQQVSSACVLGLCRR